MSVLDPISAPAFSRKEVKFIFSFSFCTVRYPNERTSFSQKSLGVVFPGAVLGIPPLQLEKWLSVWSWWKQHGMNKWDVWNGWCLPSTGRKVSHVERVYSYYECAATLKFAVLVVYSTWNLQKFLQIRTWFFNFFKGLNRNTIYLLWDLCGPCSEVSSSESYIGCIGFK